MEFLNWAANQTGRGTRDGGFFSEMWDGFPRSRHLRRKKCLIKLNLIPPALPDPAIQTEAKRN